LIGYNVGVSYIVKQIRSEDEDHQSLQNRGTGGIPGLYFHQLFSLL